MSIKLYMDEHVPRAVTEGLRQRGIDVLTTQEDGQAGVSDGELLDRATQLGRALFTQDTDFLIEADLRQRTEVSSSDVIYCHQLASTIGGLVRDLELIAKVSEPSDLKNRVEHLPL